MWIGYYKFSVVQEKRAPEEKSDRGTFGQLWGLTGGFPSQVPSGSRGAACGWLRKKLLNAGDQFVPDSKPCAIVANKERNAWSEDNDSV